MKFLSLLQNQAGQIERGRRWICNAIHQNASAGGVKEIQYIVEGRGECVNILAIERRDEGLVQLGEDVMSDFVARTFDTTEFSNFGLDVFVIGEKIHHDAGAGDQVLGRLGEHLEESIIPWDEGAHREMGAPRWYVERGIISWG